MTFWQKGTGSSMSYNITQPFEFKTYLNNMVKIASGGIPDSDEWQQTTISFNSGDNVQLCLVLANSYVNMNDTNRFDDIYITVDPDNGKIIKNGGFERDLAGWSYWNVNSTVSDVAYEGEKSLLLAITESQVYPGFYQEFNVEANTDYRLKFTYKGTGSWQSVWAVTETGMLTVDNALLTDSLYSKEDWTNVDCIFNSGEHTKLRIWFRGGVSSEIYLDAISIEKYEKTKPGAPEAPTVSEHTQSSVTLNEVLGYEYSLDGINYSTNPTFTGLFTGMEYSFYQRIQADEFNLPSDASAAAVYKITAYGDANADGEIKSDDIAQIVKVLFGSVSEYSQDGCDSNGDKMIDIRDLVNLKKKLAENTVDSSFILFGRDISDYVIVYSGDDSNVQDGINALNTAVEGRSGQKLPVVSERAENTPAIILNIDDAYADSYSVKSDINNCLSVSAGTAELINNALTVLAERITEYPKELTLSITEDYLLELDWKAALSNYKLIAFTFDDAPHYSSVGDNRTTKIIDTFKKYNGAATFFVIGSAFDSYGTSLMQYALDNGFELGNHGNTHVNLVGKTKEEIREEIVTLNDYVKDTYGYTMKFFRPSGIGTDENVFSVATELGMPVISGSRHNDLRDWDAETTAESIKEKCLAGAYDGQIVLMHAGSKSAEVIDEICAALYSQGYRFVTLSELFKYKNIAFEDIPTDHLIYDSGLN